MNFPANLSEVFHGNLVRPQSGALCRRAVVLAALLTGCNHAAGVPIFIPPPQPVPIEVSSDSAARSHQLTHPLTADSASINGPAAAAEDFRLPPDQIVTVDAHSGDINSLVTTADGKRAYSGGNDGKVIQTSLVGSADQIAAIETSVLLTGDKPIQALALDNRGKSLAISQYGSIVIYDLDSRQMTARLTRLDGRVTAIAWDSRGELLALGRADGGLFVWNVFNGPHAGEDSLDAVERYNGGISPIERIIFHPSARIFFALEKKGLIGIWRLARTELEMGLRDNEINPNQPQLGIRRWTFVQLSSPIEDFGITEDGSFLHLILADGKAIQWKIRGLKPIAAIGSAEANSYQLAEINLVPYSGGKMRLFATTGRTETLSFWCQNRPAPGAGTTIVTADDESGQYTSTGGEGDADDDSGGVGSTANDPTAVNLVNEFTDVSGGILAAEPIAGAPEAMRPLWRTVQLRQPLKAIVAPKSGRLLWASQKTGNLLVFKLNSLTTAPAMQRYGEQCKDWTPAASAAGK